MKRVLVTGAAGFIGFHLCKKLLNENYQVVGLDNLNNYYDVNLKLSRLENLGFSSDIEYNKVIQTTIKSNIQFIKLDIADRNNLDTFFKENNFDIVCNLAAQAGVRYSIENPQTYIDSNLVGFANILECCKQNNIEHLVYASSSSVYGKNKTVPFSENQQVDNPISLYAATKKANELLAHTYSHLFNLKTTGLRFFTVYGPWGRPDMATFLFTDAILNDRPIKVFNHGEMYRDFTFIDDIVDGVFRVIHQERKENYKVYNIGNNNSVKLMDFITELENLLDKKAVKNFLPIQPGDVEKTWADVNNLMNDYGYNPTTDYKTGLRSFVDWYKSSY